MKVSLDAVFLAHAPAGLRPALSGLELGPTLDAALASARAAWPEVELEPEELVRWLAERVDRVPPELDHAVDLYLACACAQGDEQALTAFETLLSRAAVALPRVADSETFTDEALAITREKLFVGRHDRRPKIHDYTGRADLGSWLKVVVARVGLDLLRRRKPGHERAEELLAALPSTDDDPELAHLKSRYGEAFRAALREAANELSVRDRNLLRQYHVDGLSMEQLARLYGIHRVTAVRRVVAARQILAERTRRLLGTQLGVDARELESILRLVRSQLHVTLGRILRETREVPGA